MPPPHHADPNAEISLSAPLEASTAEVQEPAPPQLFSRAVKRQRRMEPEEDRPAPDPRFGHSAVVHGDDMVVYGGRGMKCHGDVWLLHLPTRKWRKAAQNGAEVPVARAGHSAVVWKGSMYIFGGVADGGSGVHTQWLDDLWALRLDTFEWRRVASNAAPTLAGYFLPQPASGPGRRRGHTAHVWGDSMFVYGGGRDEETQYGDLWEFNFNEEQWILRPILGHTPPPRMYHVGSVAPVGRLVIFGGRTKSGQGFLNDTFVLDLAASAAFVPSGTPLPVPCKSLQPSGQPPAPRMCAAAICHNQSFAVITGGAYAYLGDVHQLNLRTMEWSKTEGIEMYGGRTSPSAVHWRDAIVAFGGCNSMTAGGYLNDAIEVMLEAPSLSQVVTELLKDSGLSTDRDLIRGVPETVRAMLVDGDDAMLVDDAATNAALAPMRPSQVLHEVPMSPGDPVPGDMSMM